MMRPPVNLSRVRQCGFTMVEIALCIGIIGFALVAIIGILPTGLRVQQENREDTLINQDAQYLLEALRSGATNSGADVLTNFVDRIVTGGITYSNSGGPNPFYTGREIIGLLSRPTTNEAIVRTISGTASELAQTPLAREFAFRYQLHARVKPIERVVTPAGSNINVTVISHHELNLEFRWPLRPNGSTGSGRKLFRTIIAGTLTNDTAPNYLWFFYPQNFLP